MLTDIPIVGRTYNTFDDGKINEDRLYKVVINEVILFENIDKKTLQQWKREVRDCPWLYNKVTDLFIKGMLDTDELVTYCRTKDNKWFSLGMWGSQLDVDGSLYIRTKKY